jgi:hypothetical protein
MIGDRKKQEQAAQLHEKAVDDEVIDIRLCKSRRIPPLMWRECIKKIWFICICTWNQNQRMPPVPEPEKRILIN